MKKLLFFALFGAVIFTSCTMEKRHYRSGFYVNFNKNAKTEVVSESNNDSESRADFTENILNPEPASEQTPEITLVNELVNSTSQENETLPAIVITQNHSEDIIAPEQSEKTNVLNNETKSSSAADPDFPVWAYILIALILPPLAVALKYGVHTAFWLCLLFTLLGFVPGLVYALVYLALAGNNPDK